MTTTIGGEPVPDGPALRVWLRRAPGGRETWALRFEVQSGRAVLRVRRPGVLIVPPARSRGHEDQLDAEQLRTSVLMVVPDKGPRQAYHLSGLDDRFLLDLEPECWTELEVDAAAPGGEGRILPPQASAIISLSGEVDPALPTLADLASFATLIERRAKRGPNESTDDLPELIEAGDPGSEPPDSPVPTAPPRGAPGPAPAGSTPPFRLQANPPPVQRGPIPRGRPDPVSPLRPTPEPTEGGRYLARHLRRQLELRDRELEHLRARIAELEAALSRRG